MSVRGWVMGAAWERQGSELTAAVSVGALVLPVENVDEYDDEGGIVELNGERLVYSDGAVDEDASTITLDVGPTTAAAEFDRVFVVDGGQIATDYTLFVSLGEGDEAEVEIPFEQRERWPEGEYADPVQVLLSDDLERIEEVPGRTPLIDQNFIDVPTSKLYLAANSAAVPNVTWTRVTGWSVRTLHDFDAPTVAGWQPIRETGRYLVVGSHNWVPNSTGVRRVRLVQLGTNGVTETVLRITSEAPNEGGFAAGQVVDSYFLEAGQAVALDVYQSSGAGLALQGDAAGVSTGLLLVRMST